MRERTRSGGSACLVLALVFGLGLVAAVCVVAIGFVVFVRWQSAAARPIGGPSVTPAATVPDTPPPSETATTDDESPDFTSKTSFTPYVVSGRTASELRGEMNVKGPTDTSGHHDAFTRWHVRWTFAHDQSELACGTRDVHVEVQVTYTLPDWTPPADADAGVFARWQRYRRALRAHEDGHRDHGIDAGHEVLRKVRAIASQSTCPELDRQANAAANAVLDDYRKKDVDYDAETRHGATQGAVFP